MRLSKKEDFFQKIFIMIFKDVLTHPRVRVIVVEEYTPHVNSHGHGKEAIVLEMRSFGLNAAPSTSCTDSTSLAESSSSSLGERWDFCSLIIFRITGNKNSSDYLFLITTGIKHLTVAVNSK